MTDTTRKELAPPGDWRVNNMRLTAFPSASAVATLSTWWEDVVGDVPETKVDQPRAQAQRAEGPLGPGLLTLAVQPIRIDWRLGPHVQSESFDPQSPVIGNYPEILELFVDTLKPWLGFDNLPPLQRLAYGAVLLLPVSDGPSGYERISEYLPAVDLDPTGSSDFAYQINRPRQSTSGIEGMTVNRLTKWAVLKSIGAIVRLGAPAITRVEAADFFAIRLELDINSWGEYEGELPTEGLVPLFEEFVTLGNEIVENGDIA